MPIQDWLSCPFCPKDDRAEITIGPSEESQEVYVFIKCTGCGYREKWDRGKPVDEDGTEWDPRVENMRNTWGEDGIPDPNA